MKKLLLSTLVLLLSALSMYAQVTTSSLTGTIKDAKESLIGATVKATHQPTGTAYASSTNGDGRFTIQNMRAGGPYVIEITYVGYEPQKRDNIMLKLGEPYIFNAVLKESGTELGVVTVTATDPRSVLNSDRSGTVTNIGTREIATLPTITRSINDLTRLTPQSNPNSVGSVGGGNYRQNNITVDGSSFNNSFGIGTNLPGNGSPIPLDALEEISVNITPIDVRQSGFIGSSLNATTRSGTNEFSGSGYTYFRNQDNLGTRVKSFDKLIPAASDVKTYGARLGGPIIKDKLFFFASIESDKQTRVGQTKFASTPEAPFPASPIVNRPTRTELDEISQYLKDKYNYETGAYDGYGFASERLNIVARLDWNINKDHRFNIRYSQLESKNPSLISNSTNPLSTPSGYSNAYPLGGNRTDNNALAFQNSNYFQESNFYSLAGELNSTFGMFSNTLRGTYTNQNDPRSSESSVFPLVDILKDGRPFTSFGYEPFTYGNLRDVQAYSFVDYVQFTLGKHNLLAGVQADFSTTKNGFQRFGTGYYMFSSFDDFKADAQPLAYAKTFSLSPGYEQVFPTFKFAQYAVYAQDDFTVTDKLRLSFGLRGDFYYYPTPLATHPLIAALSFAGGEKLDTGNLPDYTSLISPRFGFNYDINGDRTFQLRGSAGIFSGGIPYVWIVSQAGDSGMLQFSQVIQDPANTPKFNPDINGNLPATQPVAGTSIPNSVSVISPKLKAPQTFKASFAVDKKLPWGITGTLEGIYNRDINTVAFRNANLVAPQNLNIAGYPDNRLMYPNATGEKFINVINSAGQVVPNNTLGAAALNTYVLDNASKGYYYSVTAKLEKQFNQGFSASLAYIKSSAKSLFDGGGDQPSGAWLGNATVNGSNNAEMGYAGFVVPDRVIANLSYKKEYLKNLGTTISLIFDGSSQGRVSYIYGGDLNRDGANADLIYVPKDPSEITFTPFTAGTAPNAVTYSAKQQSDIFFRLIEQDSYLTSRRGKYAERNGGLLPWFNQVDINILQDVFVNIGKKRNTLQFNLGIENLGNFLNSNWGVKNQIVNASILVPTNQAVLIPGGVTKPTFRLQFDDSNANAVLLRDNVSFASTYRMQFGLRYIFN